MVADLLRLQAGWCDRLGSPLYARLLEHAATDVAAMPVQPAKHNSRARDSDSPRRASPRTAAPIPMEPRSAATKNPDVM